MDMQHIKDITGLGRAYAGRRLSRAEILERLRPELSDYLVEHPFFGLIIDHPLVEVLHLYALIDPPPSRSVYEVIDNANAQLDYKNKAVREAVACKDWRLFAFLHERPWRLQALLRPVSS